jgi:hypothetical protein
MIDIENERKKTIVLIDRNLRTIFMAKRVLMDLGLSEEDVDGFIADTGNNYNTRFQSLSAEEMANEIIDDLISKN